MSIFKCKMCGGTIEFNEGDTVGVCDSCGTKQTLPRLDSDRKANLYDRANHFRRNNEFDKAMSIYEHILNEDPTDAEAYWSLVLCRYGIEYVEDPATRKRVPTVNRAQFTSIFADEDYKQALAHADLAQRTVYEAEARAIDEIQKGILEISAKEEPFDVFICYKETDQNGRRTPDSVLATDLYHQLSNEGFKVFFSRITLEDKLGQEYEPYIFAALNSAKAMVVLGTKPEHFNAVWVKNEWSRYLALIKAGAKKTLIPAYRDMDPYDLPEEFSHLQAQDMSKLGFMQDLIRGIKKLVKTDEPKQTIRETIVQQATQTNTAPLLRRAFMFLEDGNFVSADEYCEKVLDIEPENAEAYLGKLMAELKVKTRDALKDQPQPFDDRNNYKKAVRFGGDGLKAELSGANRFIRDRNETARKEGVYRNAAQMRSRDTIESCEKATALFASVSGYKDASEKAKESKERAEELKRKKLYNECKEILSDVDNQSFGRWCDAVNGFESLGSYLDSAELAKACRDARFQFLKDQTEIAGQPSDFRVLGNGFKMLQDERDVTEWIERCEKDEIYFTALDKFSNDKSSEAAKQASELLGKTPGWRDADSLRLRFDEAYGKRLKKEELKKARAEYEKEYPLCNQQERLKRRRLDFVTKRKSIAHRRSVAGSITAIVIGAIWFILGCCIPGLSDGTVFILVAIAFFVPAIIVIVIGCRGLLPLEENRGKVDYLQNQIDSVDAQLDEIKNYPSFDAWKESRMQQMEKAEEQEGESGAETENLFAENETD